MAIDPALLEVLACPEDKGPLLFFKSEGVLYNPRNRRRYRVEDDLPVMLIPESQVVSLEEHQRLMAKATAEGVGFNFP